MDIGRKEITSLCHEMANSWKGILAANQRSILAQEMKELITAILEREKRKGGN